MESTDCTDCTDSTKPTDWGIPRSPRSPRSPQIARIARIPRSPRIGGLRRGGVCRRRRAARAADGRAEAIRPRGRTWGDVGPGPSVAAPPGRARRRPIARRDALLDAQSRPRRGKPDGGLSRGATFVWTPSRGPPGGGPILETVRAGRAEAPWFLSVGLAPAEGRLSVQNVASHDPTPPSGLPRRSADCARNVRREPASVAFGCGSPDGGPPRGATLFWTPSRGPAGASPTEAYRAARRSSGRPVAARQGAGRFWRRSVPDAQRRLGSSPSGLPRRKAD